MTQTKTFSSIEEKNEVFNNIMRDKLYLVRFNQFNMSLVLGGDDSFFINIEENIPEENLYNLMWDNQLVGGIHIHPFDDNWEYDKVTGKINLSSFTDDKIKTCVLNQLSRFPTHMLLRRISGGKRYKEDKRNALTKADL